jgi:hypothetical protein
VNFCHHQQEGQQSKIGMYNYYIVCSSNPSMTSNTTRGIVAAIFVAVAALAIAAATSIRGISITTPAFAQDENMTGGGGNVTNGNMTAPDIAGSGVATPPVMIP